MSDYTPESIDRLAQVIRVEDGNHSLGAGALAEAIISSGWYAEVIRAAKAEGWDELSGQLEDELPFGVAVEYPNPYREGRR